MALVARHTRPEDYSQCLSLMQDNFVFNTDTLRQRLTSMWTSLLCSGAARSAVLIDSQAQKEKAVVGFGMAVFVSNTFRKLVMPSDGYSFISLEALNQWERSRLDRTMASPILSFSDIVQHNSPEKPGLHWLGLHTGWKTWSVDKDETRIIQEAMIDSLFENLRGYKLSSFSKEVYGREEVEIFRQGMGAEVTNTHGFNLDAPVRTDLLPRTDSRHPFLVTVNEPATNKIFAQGMHRYSHLASYLPPRVNFSQTQFRILEAAMYSWKTEDVARVLESWGETADFPTINREFQNMYKRLDDAYPDWDELSRVTSQNNFAGSVKKSGRGKEGANAETGDKRRSAMMNFLKRNPWELRPHAWLRSKQRRSA